MPENRTQLNCLEDNYADHYKYNFFFNDNRTKQNMIEE